MHTSPRQTRLTRTHWRGRPTLGRCLLQPALLSVALACGSVRIPPVTPADIPDLETRVRENPGNGHATLQLAAAYLSADNCEQALATARRGIELRPGEALGPLVAGECLERGGDAVAALALYDDFTARFDRSPGAAAVSARAFLARRALATARARELIAAEQSLTAEPPQRNVLAVMPLDISGDSMYESLSVGIANILSSDLALVQGFRLVERLELGALLAEMRLAASGAVESETAVRAGRILRAGTMVAGVATIPSDESLQIDVRMIDPTTRIVGTESVSGSLRDLLRLEKDLVLDVAAGLGYQLSAAERRAILDNGTRNLAAFLAFSRGLIDQDAGNYAGAAANFGRAVQADPAFRQARDAYRAASLAPAVQQAGSGSATTLATATVTEAAPAGGAEPTTGTLAAGVQEVAPTLGEKLGGGSLGGQAASTSASAPAPVTTGVISQAVIFGFRFVLRFP